MQPILLTATAEKVTIEEAEVTSPVLDDGLPPPTFAQIAYWRELCGAIAATGRGGMADDAWSADLTPLQADAEGDGGTRADRPPPSGLAPQARVVRQGRGAPRSGGAHPAADPRRTPASRPAQLRRAGGVRAGLPLAGCPAETPCSPAVRRAARAARRRERGADRLAPPHAQVPHRPPHQHLRVGALADLEGSPAQLVEGRRSGGPRAVPRPADALRPLRRRGGHRHLVPQPHRPRRAALRRCAASWTSCSSGRPRTRRRSTRPGSTTACRCACTARG